MGSFGVEKLFGAVAALVIFGAVGYVFATTPTTGPSVGVTPSHSTAPSIATAPTKPSAYSVTLASANPTEIACSCYKQAFKIAASESVQSAAYRTGFEQCRAQAGLDGGNAWTAGWNARMNGAVFESSCRRGYLKRRAQ